LSNIMTVSDGGLSDDSSVHSSDGAPSRASSPLLLLLMMASLA